MKKTITKPATAEKGENEKQHINKGFVTVPTQLLAEVAAKKITVSAYALYAFLLFWQGTNSKLWHGVKGIAKETGFSQTKVRRLLQELISAGHIKRTETMGNSRTVCLTRVDKSRQVFISGEPVDVFLRRKAGKNGDSESVRCGKRATITAETKLAPIIPDKEGESSKQSRTRLARKTSPPAQRLIDDEMTDEQHEEWMCNHTWNEGSAYVYCSLEEKLGRKQARRRLIEWEVERGEYGHFGA